jgi:hypothetical protein
MNAATARPTCSSAISSDRPTATPSKTMLPVITLVKVPPSRVKATASVAPVTSVSPTARTSRTLACAAGVRAGPGTAAGTLTS